MGRDDLVDLSSVVGGEGDLLVGRGTRDEMRGGELRDSVDKDLGRSSSELERVGLPDDDV